MFLHTYTPTSVFITIGPISVFYYGIVIALAIIAALYITTKLAKRQSIDSETIFDMATWLLVGGIVGARLYEVILELPYYLKSPQAIIQVWQGGLAIHGALLGGLLALLFFTRRRKINFWQLLSLALPGVAIAQAIGRWGNWFNQELFGLPTNVPWSIPISITNRPAGFETFIYFHPTFLYESLGCLVIGLVLYYMVRQQFQTKVIVGYYALLYGLLRFGLEFIKIDQTPVVAGLRWPQVISLLLIGLGIFLLRSSQPVFKAHKDS